MKKTNLLTACFLSVLTLFIPAKLFPQKSYSPGYVVTSTFDTIKGMINLRTNNQNKRVCNFIRPGSPEPVSYGPEDIRAFRIDNSKYYVSREIELDSVKQTVFLEYLVDGIVDLYYLKTLTDEYFFVEKDNVMTVLSNKSHLVNRTVTVHNGSEFTKTYEVNSERYKNVLRYLFQDSPETLREIQQTSFAYRPLINIAVDYHNNVCKDWQCINFTRSIKKNIYFEPFVGIVNSEMHLETSSDAAKNTGIIAGMMMRFQPVKTFSRWNVLTGLNFSHSKFDKEFITRLYNQPYPNDRLTQVFTEYSSVRFPVMLERSFSDRELQPMISAGVTGNFLLNKKFYTADIDPEAHLQPAEIRTYMRTFQLGYCVEAGIRLWEEKKSYFVFAIGYEHRAPLTDFGWILDKHWVNSFVARAGYGFRLK